MRWRISTPREAEGIFFMFTVRPGQATGGKTHKPVVGSPGILNSQTCPQRASSNASMTVQVFPSRPHSCGGSHSWVSALARCSSLQPPVCLLRVWLSGWPRDLTSLTDLRRLVGFPVYSTFKFGDFQTPYSPAWKCESCFYQTRVHGPDPSKDRNSMCQSLE